MTRKEILLCQLGECRNEFANALDGLTPEQLAAQPIPGKNSVGWIVAHCMRNFDFFLIELQTGHSRLDTAAPEIKRWQSDPPGEDNPPPDLANLARQADEQFSAAVELVERLDEDAFSRPAPAWRHELYETTAGNCVRVINHSNAHMRQIWLLRGLMEADKPWPTQTLVKDESREDMPFIVPKRGK